MLAYIQQNPWGDAVPLLRPFFSEEFFHFPLQMNSWPRITPPMTTLLKTWNPSQDHCSKPEIPPKTTFFRTWNFLLHIAVLMSPEQGPSLFHVCLTFRMVLKRHSTVLSVSFLWQSPLSVSGISLVLAACSFHFKVRLILLSYFHLLHRSGDDHYEMDRGAGRRQGHCLNQELNPQPFDPTSSDSTTCTCHWVTCKCNWSHVLYMVSLR